MKYQPFETDSLALLRTALERLAQGFADLPSSASDAPDVAGMAGVLDSVGPGSGITSLTFIRSMPDRC